MHDLGLVEMRAYRTYLETHPDEWSRLDHFCRIPISRFYRDRGVFDRLAETVIPSLSRALLRRDRRELRCWSAGCASGEEPYTLRLMWAFRLQRWFPDIGLGVVATDADANLLRRAERACYAASSLKELLGQAPSALRILCLVKCGCSPCQAEQRRRSTVGEFQGNFELRFGPSIVTACVKQFAKQFVRRLWWPRRAEAARHGVFHLDGLLQGGDRLCTIPICKINQCL